MFAQSGMMLQTNQGYNISSHNGYTKRNETFPGLRQLNQRPGFHAPYVRRHEEDDDHPLPPAKDIIHMGSSTRETELPGSVESNRTTEHLAPDQTKERNDKNYIEEKGEQAAPANLGKTRCGLLQVAGTDRPFTKVDGHKWIREESDQHKSHDCTLCKVGFLHHL